MIIHPQRPIASASSPRSKTESNQPDWQPLDRYTPQGRRAQQATSQTEAQPRSFWKGAAVGGGLTALACLAVGATGPLGWMMVGCAALVAGVHHRDGGISQEKLQQLGDWNRQLQEP